MINTKTFQAKIPKNLGRKSKEIRFFASVEFGRFSQDCQNLGICRIEPETQNRSFATKKKCTSCTYLAEIIYLKPDDLKMVLNKKGFNEKCIEKYFSTGHFILEEDFETTFFLQQLSGKRRIEIKKGSYPILELKTTYQINFMT